jgi:hypothetical protein
LLSFALLQKPQLLSQACLSRIVTQSVSATTCKLTDSAPIGAVNTGKVEPGMFTQGVEERRVCDRAHLCALPRWLCASEGRRLWVFAEGFGRVAGRFCAKKPGLSPSRYPGALLSDFPFRHYGHYGRKWVTPHVTAPKKCNSGAELTALNVGRFAGSGVRHVPKYPSIGECGRVPKRPTARRPTISPAPRRLKSAAPIKRESKRIDRAYSPTGAAMLSTASANFASRAIVAGDTLDSPARRSCGGRSLSVKLII